MPAILLPARQEVLTLLKDYVNSMPSALNVPASMVFSEVAFRCDRIKHLLDLYSELVKDDPHAIKP